MELWTTGEKLLWIQNKETNKTSELIEISMRESNYCMFFMEANRSKIL